ncbi:MAG: hypothetical protein Q8N77_00490 [Nanoarchaeota archaeon]|nr:hypothetical protein [Nanoarchaeota archaeon]
MIKNIFFVILFVLLILIAGCTKETEPQKIAPQKDLNKECAVDSDCKFECSCGCINIKSECKEIALCNMPPGSCKCINNECQFVEKEGWKS